MLCGFLRMFCLVVRKLNDFEVRVIDVVVMVMLNVFFEIMLIDIRLEVGFFVILKLICYGLINGF